DPYDEQVGFIVLNCAFALADSGGLRQPWIASRRPASGGLLWDWTSTVDRFFACQYPARVARLVATG
ncbi:MAG TPA: hypothetical protein DDZ90_13740, partial [Planctomycetaceae bacterium]|nr:hypothetical protein [Planctomycetaceae bacterium]